MRWWREFHTPALKCDRLEHEWREERRRGYMTTSAYEARTGYKTFRAVAMLVREKVERCQRCHKVGVAELLSGESIQSLSLPTASYDRLEEAGVLWQV